MKNPLGQLVFWLGWPMFWVILNNTKRSRLLLISNNKILVVKGWLNDGKWSLPGGGIHKNESPIASIVREVREELGLTLSTKQCKILGEGQISEKGIKSSLHYFVAEIPETIAFSRKNIEIKTTIWYEPAALNTVNASTDVLQALKLWKR